MSEEKRTISAELEQELSALGRSGSPGLLPSVRTSREAFAALVGCGPDAWNEFIDTHSSDAIRVVLMGIVLLARGLGSGIGGSVSPVIPLFRELKRRGAPELNELTAWIVQHRMNAFEPFGTRMASGVRSLGEYNVWHSIRSARREEAHTADLARQNADRARRVEAATSRLANAVRRGDVLAVRALLSQGARVLDALPAGGSLQELAQASGRQRMLEFLVNAGIR